MSRYISILIQMLNRRGIIFGFTGVACLLHFGLASTPSNAGKVNSIATTQEMSVGKPNAPLTIIEYASLGCSHCARFHHETYPQLKKDFIDTGKVKFIFRDFPLGTPALAATLIARCSGPERYFGFVEIFFRSQLQWSRAENPLEALKLVARFGGMSPSDVQACVENQSLLEHVQSQKKQAYEQDSVSSTPYFIIGTEKLSGGVPYEQFKNIVETELKKAQQ